ncbi:MAG TPA: TlyA family RNA methyltransferase [Candidatus Binataceae bacterium]|jgi:23S rRNA (cytidine1920-2'-O)/16S rRNA (cytidine1409-2'-O)-methyltransferase|nr:TlyA family RNA methyltransferase [Candidatus Binataceae bacterium]
MRQRLDHELVRRNLAASREAAQRLVMAGRVRVNSRPANKADLRVAADAPIEVIGGEREFASRGAYKLEAALDSFALAVAGRRALDVGASTGGFTDLLLQRGVAGVIAVDVGYGQLLERLRVDPRVTVMDRRNIRYITAEELPYAPDLAVIDVSFISLKEVLTPVLGLCARPADIVALIKPQFEVGRGRVGKGGVVRDEAARAAALREVLDHAATLGLDCRGVIESPVAGAKGNREFLAWFAATSATADSRNRNPG